MRYFLVSVLLLLSLSGQAANDIDAKVEAALADRYQAIFHTQAGNAA